MRIILYLLDKQCPHCGGYDIVSDQTAEFDHARKEWVITVMNNAICTGCMKVVPIESGVVSKIAIIEQPGDSATNQEGESDVQVQE